MSYSTAFDCCGFCEKENKKIYMCDIVRNCIHLLWFSQERYLLNLFCRKPQEIHCLCSLIKEMVHLRIVVSESFKSNVLHQKEIVTKFDGTNGCGQNVEQYWKSCSSHWTLCSITMTSLFSFNPQIWKNQQPFWNVTAHTKSIICGKIVFEALD